jgi:hypothetical protein
METSSPAPPKPHSNEDSSSNEFDTPSFERGPRRHRRHTVDHDSERELHSESYSTNNEDSNKDGVKMVEVQRGIEQKRSNSETTNRGLDIGTGNFLRENPLVPGQYLGYVKNSPLPATLATSTALPPASQTVVASKHASTAFTARDIADLKTLNEALNSKDAAPKEPAPRTPRHATVKDPLESTLNIPGRGEHPPKDERLKTGDRTTLESGRNDDQPPRERAGYSTYDMSRRQTAAGRIVRRLDTVEDDYGDNGYGYTNPPDVVRYDLSHSPPVSQRPSNIILVRPSSATGLRDSPRIPGSGDERQMRERNSAPSHLPDKRQNRDLDSRDILPESSTVPRKPTVETVGRPYWPEGQRLDHISREATAAGLIAQAAPRKNTLNSETGVEQAEGVDRDDTIPVHPSGGKLSRPFNAKDIEDLRVIKNMLRANPSARKSVEPVRNKATPVPNPIKESQPLKGAWNNSHQNFPEVISPNLEERASLEFAAEIMSSPKDIPETIPVAIGSFPISESKPRKGILRPPRERFPEDPLPIREGVAQLAKATEDGIPPDARWTKISRRLVNPEALDLGKERYEAREGFVIVLRVLSREEVQGYAEVTQLIRGK